MQEGQKLAGAINCMWRDKVLEHRKGNKSVLPMWSFRVTVMTLVTLFAMSGTIYFLQRSMVECNVWKTPKRYSTTFHGFHCFFFCFFFRPPLTSVLDQTQVVQLFASKAAPLLWFGLLCTWQRSACTPETAKVWEQVPECNLLITQPSFKLCKLSERSAWERCDVMAHFAPAHNVFM